MALTKVTTHVIADDIALGGNPTTTTQSTGNSSTRIATTAFVQTELASLVDSAPSSLNTLNELAAALGDDANFSTTVTNSIATKLPLAGGTMTGSLGVGDTAVSSIRGLFSTSTANHIAGQFVNSNASDSFGIVVKAGNDANDYTADFRNKDNTNLMRIRGDGKVGIGETTPLGNLHVKSADNGGSADGSADELVVEGSGNSGLSILSGASNYGTILFGDSGDSAAGRFRYEHDNNRLNFGTNGSWDRMVIDSGGSIGIGNTNPGGMHSAANKLVVGTGSGDQGMSVYAGTSQGRYAFARALGNNTDAYDGGMSYDGNRNLTFHTNAGTERVRIDGGGKVGIGVLGSLSNILQIKSTASGGPQIQIGDGTNYGFINFDGQSMQISTQRDMVDGTWYNTNKSWGGINIVGGTGGSEITFTTATGPNTAPATNMKIDQSGRVGIATTTTTNGQLNVYGGGGSAFSTLSLLSTTSTEFNHAVNAFNSNLTSGENNLLIIGRAGSTRNSAWMGYKYYSDASYSNCLTFGHWGNNNILNLNGYGVFMGGGLETAPNYPGAITTARTGNSSTTSQATWGFNAHAGGSAIDFGFKTSGSGSYAVGVINAAETTWMSRLDYSGAIHLTNTTVQSISDRRLKKDIVDANSQWNDIKALQFKNFKWKDTARGEGTYLGLIADEVESVSPGLVGIDAVSAETMPNSGEDPEYKNVKYSILWMKATKALQEAMTRIETLEAKVEALEG